MSFLTDYIRDGSIPTKIFNIAVWHISDISPGDEDGCSGFGNSALGGVDMSGWQSMISILPPDSEIGVNFVGVDISLG